MSKWYYYRLIRIWILRNPFKGMALSALLAFVAGAGIYAWLDQFAWGKIILELIFMMISFEATTTTMITNSKPFWQIISLVIIADTCNIMLDLFFVRWLLKWKSFRSKIDWLSKQGKKIWVKIKLFFTRNFSWLPFINLKSLSANGWSYYFDNWSKRLEDYKKNPTKAGYGAIFILSLSPRIPFLVIGGVSVAVFIIRYNRFDYRAWLVLILGILFRTCIWLSSMYGLISLF